MKKKKQKVQMPAGIRQKLMAAVSMLMVSIIMLVSSTYAWFTLSTAPEVTGISTSVGANGNLEMALLNGTADGTSKTDTYADTTKITSAVGDSSAATKDVTKSNITWGNLVDLSAASYHLNDIKLMPAAVNMQKDGDVVSTTQLAQAGGLLQTAVYGADGRVEKLSDATVTGVYKDGGWDVSGTTYGVRAVGVAAGMSVKEAGYNAAKGAYKSNLANAYAGMASAINNNMVKLAGISGDDPITEDQKAAALAVLNGASTDLKTLTSAYKNLIIASAASKGALSDKEFATLKDTINGMTIATLSTSAATYAEYLPATATKQLAAIATMTTNVSQAQATVTDAKAGETKASELKAAIKDVVGTNPSSAEAAKNTPYYWSDGVIGTIANSIGNYTLVRITFGGLDKTIYGGKQETVTAVLTANSVPNATFGTTTATTITDVYGYVLDFAFRTNAATSNLQLQTEAMNRVYSSENSDSLATMGAGSTVTYTYKTGAGVTADQADVLLKAIKLVFFNPDTKAVYATGALTDINALADKATAKIELTKEDKKTITALTQNTVQKVSVLVYMDGNSVDNTAVSATGTESGTLSLNLQFSSSATLNPMQNNTLKNMQKEETQTTSTVPANPGENGGN